MWSSHCFGLYYQWTSWPECVSFFRSWACLWHFQHVLLLSLSTPPPVSLLPAIHLSYVSLLWITETVLWESCPNTFVLPKQSITVSYLHTFGLLSSPGAKVTRGPAGQLVPIASRGLFFWGPPSQPGCSDVRRAGYQPQETSKLWPTGGNRRRAQMHTMPSHSF